MTFKYLKNFNIFSDPLRALCAIQLSNGAVMHDSKAKALAEGTWKGDRPVTNRNKLNKERKMIERYQNSQGWSEWERQC